MTAKNPPGNLKFYTTNDIADMLKMNVQVIARKLQKGEIHGYKIGKDWRVTESALMNWLEKHSNQNIRSTRDRIVGRFMQNGKITAFPMQRKKRRYVLEFLLDKFDLNRVYAEAEVNDIIREYYDDFCWARREFIMEKMMYRSAGKYRRNSAYRMSKD